MKLNATSEMEALTQHGWSNVHPFQPADSVQGYHYIIEVAPLVYSIADNRNCLTISKQSPVSTKSPSNPTPALKAN
jgi:glycine cleavage system protein P-like pyridoxal-binding family